MEHGVAELEWRRYRNDPAGFMRDLLWVPNPRDERGRVRLDLFDYQEETLEAWLDHRFVLVLKARQLGLSTIAMAYALWHLMFRPGATIILVSKDQPTANKALGLMEFMWDFMSDRAKARAPKLEVDSATEKVWRFADGMTSRIISRPATDSAGVGETATLVIWDEAALSRDGDGTYRSLQPTTDAGGSMIVFSTARGAHNRFAKLWRLAKRGESSFKTLFFPWTVSRLIDGSDYEAKKLEYADKPWLFYAEYPSSPEEAFRQSGRQRFEELPEDDDDRLVDFPLRGHLEWDGRGGIGFVEDPAGPLRLREEARFGAPSWARTVLSVDPATGQGGDYTAMTGGWLEDGIPVRAAFWHANDIEPLEAARQADLLGRFLGGTEVGARLAVEKAGGYGETFIHELARTYEYPNMYVHRHTGHRKRRADTTFGFPMTHSRRPLVIDKLARWVLFDGKHPTIDGVDGLLLTELGQFVVTDNGRVQADTGCHDDLVMSVAIWLWVLTESVGESERADATPGTIGAGSRVTHDISYVFEEAEQIRQAQKRDGRREMRRLHRLARSRR